MSTQPLNTITAPQDWQRQLQGLGYASDLMRQCPALLERGPEYLSRVIWPAMRAGRIQFYFDADGRSAAYVVWARLPPATEVRLLAGEAVGTEQLLPGADGQLWVIDLVAPRGHVRAVLADLRDRVFGAERAVRYFRLKQGRRIVKEIERDTRLGFFRPGEATGPAWRCALEACSFCRPRWDVSAI